MLIDIYIDHNVWNFLFERKIDLFKELPKIEFSLHLTREAEFEILPTPEIIQQFIKDTVDRCNIDVKRYFGFYQEQHDKSDQRFGGFDSGCWASEEEIEFIESQKLKLGTKKKIKTRLFKNEADISLAARSLHSIVLTLDKKPGPLKNAHNRGGKVVFLTEFDSSTLTLKEFIQSAVAKSG